MNTYACKTFFLTFVGFVFLFLYPSGPAFAVEPVRIDEYERFPEGTADYRFFLDRADLFYRQEEFGSAMEHYSFARAIEPELDKNMILRFRTAYCLKQVNEPGKAIPLFYPLTADPLMGDYALYQLAGCYAMIPDSQKKAIALYRQLIRNYPRSVFRIEAHLQLTEWLSRTQQHAEAELYLSAAQTMIQKQYQTRILYEPRLTLLKGISQYHRGRFRKAINYFRIVISSFRYTDEALMAKQWIETIHRTLRSPLNTVQFLENNNVLILQGHYADALQELKDLNRTGTEKENAEIEFQTARAYYAMGLYKEAMSRFERLWKENRHADALFNLARTSRYNEDLDRSTQAYRDYLASAVKNPAWKTYIMYELANNLSAYGDSLKTLEAMELYRAIQAQSVDGSVYAAGASFREAYLLYRLKDYDSAVVRLTKLAQRLPAQQSRCQYWIAKCHERAGRPDKANIMYRQLAVHRMSDYYGMLSELLHINPVSVTPRRIFYTAGIPLLPSLGAETDRTADFSRKIRTESSALLIPESLDDSLRLTIRKALLAGKLIGPRWAESELMTVKDQFWSSFEKNIWLKHLAEEMECYNIAVDANVMLRIHYDRKMSADEINRLNYPVYYRDHIMLHAGQYTLDPSLLLAVIKAESAFRSRAVSPARAVGLMQIMPFTGRTIARQLQMPGFQMMNLQSPDVSIRMGAYYLNQQAKLFKGYIPAMLSAYNAGPHRTVFWMRFYSEEDPEVFPEMVDFVETHSYIKKILLDRWIYSQLYQDNPS